MKVCPKDPAHQLMSASDDPSGETDSVLRCFKCGANAIDTSTLPDRTVNHPPHYTSHPSGVECVDIAEHYGFLIGNAIKYLWRAGLKGDAIEDLRKAVWYIQREITKREKERNP